MIPRRAAMHDAQEVTARLRIAYPEPTAVTAAVGMPPDGSWPAGKCRPGRTVPAKFGSWYLENHMNPVPSSVLFAGAAEDCLRRLLDRVKPIEFREGLKRLDPTLRPAVVLTGFVRDLPNVYLAADIIAKIAALGADFDQDFYPLSNEGLNSGGV